MPNDTPPPPMDPVEEYRNNQTFDEDDFVVVEDSDLSDTGELNEAEDAFGHSDAHGFVEGITFIKHWEPVFCCNIDNERGLVVSGGKDDKAYVWDIKNGEIVFECTGHQDSVTHAEFNHDCSCVATGDMSGVIQVWDVQSRSQKWEIGTSELKWLQWLPGKDSLIAGTICGDAWTWDIPEGDTVIFPSYGAPSSEGKVMDEERIVIGYDDGAIRILDLNTAVAIQSVVGREAHNGAITAFDYDQSGLIISGSVDGTAKLIKAANGKVLHTFQCGSLAADGEEPESVESVAFLMNHQALITATVDGSIAVWDIGSHVQRLNFKQEGGVVKMICPKDSPLFFTAGLDGCVRLFDVRTGHQEAFWKVHAFEILDFSLTSDKQTIVTASEDGTCKVFSVRQN